VDITAGSPEPLGATLTATGVNFAVWSAHATAVEVCFYANGKETRVSLPGRTGPVFHGHVEGLKEGARYGLRVHGPDAPEDGHRFDASKLLLDPYALEIDRAFLLMHEMFAGDSMKVMPRAVVRAPQAATASISIPWEETVIYELHVRGFTKQMPDVPEAVRGTFAGLGHPAAIAHLKKLGVTTVELLPCMAWIDEPHLKRKGLTNYWGYNPIAWCAPDPRLAPGGWAEVRGAVEALATAGIETILDVVYNHSGEGDELGPTVSLRGIDNASYYRLREDDRSLYVNDAGTGNILNADHPAVVRLVMDSLRAWRRYGGFAGFRFDLATTLGRRRDGFSADAPLLTAISQDPELRTLKLIAEPWDIGMGGYQLGQFPSPWGEWNDRYRDTVRRFWRGDEMSLGDLARSLSGSQDVFRTRPPWSSVNFVTAHDGFTLKDLVSYDHKQNGQNGEDNRDGTNDNHSWVSADAARDQRNLLATLLVSRGTPMLAQGSETGQSQGGNNNAYAQDNATSWLDWAARDQALTAFCARLVAARRAHPALRGGFLSGAARDGAYPDVVWSRADGAAMDAGVWDDPQGATLVASFCEGDDRVCAIVHRGADAVEVRLPDGRWQVVIDTADDRRDEAVSGTIAVAARSVIILAEAPDARQSGVSDEVLDRLSAAAGIEREWWTIDGQQNQVPRDTKLHILDALGLPCATTGEANDSLRNLAERHDRRLLPFAVVHQGDGPVTIPLRAAADAAPVRTQVSISREDGKQAWIDVRDLPARRVFARDGRPVQVTDLVLAPLPPGRYELRRDDAPDAVCRLTVAPDRAYLPDTDARFGVTAQLYAVRRDGDQGIGDFTTLKHLMQTANARGAACVGINPLHALFPDDRDRASPYYPSDRRFLDPIYLDVPGLDPADDGPVIDYPAVWARKDAALRALYEEDKYNPDFDAFVQAEGLALARFATFSGDRAYAMYLQWLCERQLADAVAGTDVWLYRDLAIGAAPDGAEAADLKDLLVPSVSLGAPPDPFSSNGQVWAIPPFSPHALLEDGYRALTDIYRRNMRHAGALRIDHAIGLKRQFWVPAGADGRDGAYVNFPFTDLLGQLKLESVRARCRIVGEDLGTVPDGFRAVMEQAGFLSYKVLPFERDGAAFRPPAAYPRQAVACAATHDLPPLKGWWNGADIDERNDLGLVANLDAERSARARDKAELVALLTHEGLLDGADAEGPLTQAIAAAVHAFLSRTPSLLALAQVEDLAASDAVINLPGTDRERPNWRHRLPQTLDTVFASGWAQALLVAIRNGRS